MTKYYQPSTTHEEQRQHECRQHILQLQRHNWYHTKTRRLQSYLGTMYPCIMRFYIFAILCPEKRYIVAR